MIGCILRRQRAFALVGLLLFASTALRGEDQPSVKLPGESRAAALRIRQMRRLCDEQKWSEAIEELQTIVTTAGNDLVAVTDKHNVQARRLCQAQLASLPAEALQLYRRRYENQAAKKFQQAQAERDVPQLRKLVEEAFATRAAEKSIDLLGDLAFERGRFEEAEEWWRLLAPLPDSHRKAATRGLHLRYPDPSIDPARSEAKQLLARLFRGADRNWSEQLDAYRGRHGKAEGTLAGRKGRYVDLLLTLARQRKEEGETRQADWPTFGGDPSRGRIVEAPEDVLDHLSDLCRDGPTWRFNLEERARQEEARTAPAVDAKQARTLAFFPVLVGHHLLTADARYVTAYDLRTGKSHEWFDAARANGMKPNLKLPAPPDLRYTLTAADDNVYVRLGAQDVGVEPAAMPRGRGQPAKPRRDNLTLLACLSARADQQDRHFRWQLGGLGRDNAFFEGAPLVADGQIWIASTRYQGENALTAIDCYPTDDSSAPPLRWHREVCEAPPARASQPRYRHHLLTRAGTQIVYCTHNGAVVAVDALSGQVNWAIRYARRSDKAPAALRDLAPVLFAEGRLYVAPEDSDLLLCLNPSTGRTLWELEAVQIVHLLGVGQGRLIFSTPTGLRAVRADDGRHAWSVPDTGAAEARARADDDPARLPLGSTGLTPAGRGLLIGDLVLFPTTQVRDSGSPAPQSIVYALRQSDGRPADDPARLHRLPAGNLLYANGCLVVADRETLSVFVPPRLLLHERKAEARRHPSSTTRLALARAEADAGLREDALRSLRQAEDRLSPDIKSRATLHDIRTERQRLWLESAHQAARAERWEQAETAIQLAIAVPLPPRGRLHALLRAAQIWKDAGQAKHARSIWETIRADERLRQIQVVNRDGKPATASASAAAHLGQDDPPDRPQVQPEKPRVQTTSLPLLRTWHVRLGSDEWILDGWRDCDVKLLLTGAPDGRFTCRLTSSGDVRWQRRLPFGPRWAGCYGDALLVAGDEGAACLRRDDGELLWHFPAPAADRRPHVSHDEVRVVLDPQPPEPLCAFHLAGGRLFFLQGQRRLFALQAGSGRVLWDRWAPDGALRLPYPQSCFARFYYAGAQTVLVQGFGRRWLLDAATGKSIQEAADSRDLRQRPSLELDEQTLAVAPDCRHVTLLDARTGQTRWTHDLNGFTTLSGELPLLLGGDDVLLCVKPANVGYFLQRLDVRTGKPLWPRPQLLTMKTLAANAWAFDAEAVYTVEEQSLTAHSLADGRRLWRHPLMVGGEMPIPSDAAWQVRRIAGYLAVQRDALPAEASLRFRQPLAAIQWDVSALLPPESLCPLSCYDPKTGQLVQRLNFRPAGPPRTTPGKRIILAEGGRCRLFRTSSLLASEQGGVIRLDSPQPFVALGGDVWGLTDKTEPRP